MKWSGAQLEAAILERLAARDPGKTICPSEVARALEQNEPAWRALMQPVREAAWRLVAKGLVEVTQRGRPISLQHKGPVRLRLATRSR